MNRVVQSVSLPRDLLFEELKNVRGFSHRYDFNYPYSGGLEPTSGVIHSDEGEDDGDRAWIVETLDALVQLRAYGGQLYGRIAAGGGASLGAEVAKIRLEFPETEPSDDQVRVTFWSLTHTGPQSQVRRLAADKWPAIEQNYPRDTRAAISALLKRKFTTEGGKLILWHGEPGGGKTYALRALAQEWKEWAEVHYVVDPDEFFGKAPYMIQVMTSSSAQWRLIVAEDTGELLAKNAKYETGQGLSRLLNLCDGLVGQGLRLLVLITTNEELGALHPAVIRKGRCAANIEFGRLSPDEAREWLRARSFDAARAGTASWTVADLYGVAQGEDREVIQTPDRVSVGFS